MDAVESSSPYSPPSRRHKLRTTVCGCFGSPGSGGEKPHTGGGRARWRRRVAAAGDFRYDPLSFALNSDDGASHDDAEDTAFRDRNFNSRLPHSPTPASRAVAIA